MNEREAQDLVDRLRAAQKAGAPVEELLGDSARDFQHVKDVKRRPVLLGSFHIKTVEAPFFVSLISKADRRDAFQLFVNKRRRGFPSVVTDDYVGDHLRWRYGPTKQSGDNAARKAAFLKAQGSLEIAFPLPTADIAPFATAVQRAIAGRDEADGAEESEDLEGIDSEGDADSIVSALRGWYSGQALTDAVAVMVSAIREAHNVASDRWSVTYRVDRDLLRLNVGTARVFDLAADTLLLAVHTDSLSSEDVGHLGKRLDRDNPLSPGRFGPNAVVLAPPSEMTALLPRLVPSFRSLLAAAAKTAALHQRHHNPAVLAALRTLTTEQVPDPSIAATPARRSFWKISPGEGGSDWDRCRDGGFIAVGWDDVGDLASLTREQFDARVAQLGHKPGVEAIWKFKDIREGDRIVANAGTTRVLGIGTVTGPYYFVAGEKHGHRLPVTWDDVTERAVNMQGWRQTLIRLTEATFNEVTAASSPGGSDEVATEAGPVGGIDFDGILAHLETKSLAFPPEAVATYLLALQARRFVLLTGISGTGKTQLALEVARLFAPEARTTSRVPGDDVVELTIQTDHVKRGRFVVPARLAKQLDALYDEQTNRIDVRLPGRKSESMSIYKDPARPHLLMVGLSGEGKTDFQRSFAVGGRALLRREVSGKSETLVVEADDGDVPVAAEVAHELIAVRPDWTDARALFGFYNPLTKTYVSTPTLDLLRAAAAEVERAASAATTPRPYFLLFDEMNLARVEHYFSDFLSAMESGEAVHLHDDDDLAEADEAAVPKRIGIPRNVFVIGTVNVDETTYMFSPKVLDRAFVIEFNHVELGALSTRPSVEEGGETSGTLTLSRLGAGLRLLGKPDSEEWARFEGVLDGELSHRLKQIHGALEADGRHFGYRVAREIARFVDLAREQTDGSPDALRAAFDTAVLGKILPKLHGGQADIERPLQRLFEIACGAADGALGLDAFSAAGTRLERADGSDVPLPRTALKLWRMQKRLRAHGFVSFID